MKKINIFIGALLSIMAWTFSACSEDTLSDNFGNSPAVPGQGVYFAKSLSTSVKLAGESGEFELSVQRTVTEGDATVKLSTEMTQEAKAVLTIPSSVSFKDGEKETKLKVSYQNAVQGTPYILKIVFEDGTEYANSTQTFTVEYPFPEVWKVVSEDAVFVDQFLSMFSVSDLTFRKVTVEKQEGKNRYRFLSPYDNDYMTMLDIDFTFPSDFNYPYIIIDGDKYTKASEDSSPVNPEDAVYYIPAVNLGFSLDGSAVAKYDPAWNTFGTIAGNLSVGGAPVIPGESSDYPSPTYNKKTMMFDFGSCYNNLSDYGYQIYEGSQLWLDPTKMEIVYDRDFEWVPMPEATGTFISNVQQDRGRWIQELEKAVVEPGEDPLYHFTSLYAPDVNIVFYHNKEKGIVRMPKKQKTGMTSFGNDVYVDMKKGAYDEKSKTYTFEFVFYLVDKTTGDKTAELATTEEKFMVGYAATIDSYVGNWTATLKGKTTSVKVPITISKNDDESLIVKGLSGTTGYDDSMLLGFNKDKRTITWQAQNMSDIQIGANTFSVLGTPVSISAGMYAMDDVLVGGVNEDGNIVFENAAGNKYPVDSFEILALDNEGNIASSIAEISSLTWEKVLDMKPVKSAKTGFASSFRTYNTKLNYKPIPVKNTTSLKRDLIQKKITVPFRLVE